MKECDYLATDKMTRELSLNRQTTLLGQPPAGHTYSSHAVMASGRNETVPKGSPQYQKQDTLATDDKNLNDQEISYLEHHIKQFEMLALYIIMRRVS